jgi:crotonobetainyl-CoA:carnitine CoA-transferase CaiB-like acyl-CoA transferase
MAAGNDDLFRRACEGFDCVLLLRDSKFSSTSLRAKNQIELKEIFEKRFAGLTAEQCLGIARKQGVPCAPINTYSEALADPQVAHYGWVQPLELPNGSTRTFVSPLMKEQKPGKPPALGEHTEEVLRQLSASPRV